MLFPSTRNHIELNGAKIIDVITESAHDLASSDPFKATWISKSCRGNRATWC